MAAFIIDLDGTIVEHGTNELLPGALDFLNAIIDRGDQIIYTTRRGDVEFEGHKTYSRKAGQALVDSIGLPYHAIIFDVSSPRTVVNDGGACAHDRKTNDDWTETEICVALGSFL